MRFATNERSHVLRSSHTALIVNLLILVLAFSPSGNDITIPEFDKPIPITFGPTAEPLVYSILSNDTRNSMPSGFAAELAASYPVPPGLCISVRVGTRLQAAYAIRRDRACFSHTPSNLTTTIGVYAAVDIENVFFVLEFLESEDDTPRGNTSVEVTFYKGRSACVLLDNQKAGVLSKHCVEPLSFRNTTVARHSSIYVGAMEPVRVAIDPSIDLPLDCLDALEITMCSKSLVECNQFGLPSVPLCSWICSAQYTQCVNVPSVLLAIPPDICQNTILYVNSSDNPSCFWVHGATTHTTELVRWLVLGTYIVSALIAVGLAIFVFSKILLNSDKQQQSDVDAETSDNEEEALARPR